MRITGNGFLVVTEEPGVQVFAVPASSVQIITPRLQQRIGGGSVLQVAGKSWSVQFDRVHQAEARGLGVSPRRALGRARELNQAFVAALVAAGASDITRQDR